MKLTDRRIVISVNGNEHEGVLAVPTGINYDNPIELINRIRTPLLREYKSLPDCTISIYDSNGMTVDKVLHVVGGNLYTIRDYALKFGGK